MNKQIALFCITLSFSVRANADLSQRFAEHGYPQIEQESSLSQVAEHLADLLEKADRAIDSVTLNAHLRHEMTRLSVSDATVWLSVIKGQDVNDTAILRDLLPKLNHRLRPSHLGTGQSANGLWHVTILIHRGATFSWRVESISSDTLAFHIEGRLSLGYFQPRILLDVMDTTFQNVTLQLRTDRSFSTMLKVPKRPSIFALELVAEHVSGPRVLHMARYHHQTKTPALPTIRVGQKRSESPADALQRRIIRLRAHQGLGGLSTTRILNEVAGAHAAFIAKSRTLSHRNDVSGHLRQRLEARGQRPSKMVELLVFAPTPLAAFGALEKSPAHRAQLRRPGMTHIGIGVKDNYYAIVMARFDAPSKEVD